MLPDGLKVGQEIYDHKQKESHCQDQEIGNFRLFLELYTENHFLLLQAQEWATEDLKSLVFRVAFRVRMILPFLIFKFYL